MIKWLHHHTQCPKSFLNLKEKKIRKRDKSEGKLSNTTNFNTISTISQINLDEGNLPNHLHLSHHHYHQKKQQTHPNDISDLNLIDAENRLQNKKITHLGIRHSLILDENTFLDLSAAPTRKKSEEEEKCSLESNASSNSSANITGDSSSESICNLHKINNCNMIMTASNTTASASYPVSSVSSQLNVNYNFPTVDEQHVLPIVKQPQFISNSMLSSNNSSKTVQNQSNVLPPKQTSSQQNSNNVKNENASNGANQSNKITSFNYLDDNNLKIAIIEYNDLLRLIKLQNCMDQNEWLAFNTKMYFDQINVLYGAIADHCTPQSCPTMSAPLNNQFFWLDEKGKKCKYSASQYIDSVLTQTAKIISDESLFPTQVGCPFSSNFDALVKKIHKNLFQILAHMYHSHYKELVHLKLNTYVNSIYFHLLMFSKSFNTLEDKDIDIMDALNKSLMNKYMGDVTQQQKANMLNQQAPPTIHQPVISAPSSSSASSGFSFFKKKLNFNLMA